MSGPLCPYDVALATIRHQGHRATFVARATLKCMCGWVVESKTKETCAEAFACHISDVMARP